MKLRNKKTGEIVSLSLYGIQVYSRTKEQPIYHSLAELNEEWEDYEEPKDFWFIDDEGCLEVESEECEEHLDEMKSIGNYFDTQEEAEQAVEKLKAWKRLKDDGFEFEGVIETWFGGGRVGPLSIQFNKHDDDVWVLKHRQDLELLFGGEE